MVDFFILINLWVRWLMDVRKASLEAGNVRE